MRYYFIDSDQNEKAIDILSSVKDLSGIVNIEASIDGKITNLFFKNMLGKTFYSQDKISWTKTYQGTDFKKYFDGKDYYQVFKGFKPSGLFSGNAGNLITQMPGKIIKIMVNTGDEVKKGDTLVILEAMKMENEIKASIDGVVKNIHAETGKAVESGFLMLEIE